MESPKLNDALQRLLRRLDSERSLLSPIRLRERMEALELLDAYFPDIPRPVSVDESYSEELNRRARAIRARLEAVNCELYESIRNEIQRGTSPETLLRWVHSSATSEDVAGPVGGMGYDSLDELISGVAAI